MRYTPFFGGDLLCHHTPDVFGLTLYSRRIILWVIQGSKGGCLSYGIFCPYHMPVHTTCLWDDRLEAERWQDRSPTIHLWNLLESFL